MQRFFIVFLGRVQGVGFRYTISNLAGKYFLTGWVRNRYDGSVECELQGHPRDVDALIREAMCGNRYINVEDYSIKKIAVVEGEKGFNVRY